MMLTTLIPSLLLLGCFTSSLHACFERNMDYYGHDLNYPAGRNEDRTDTAGLCQAKCREMEGCQHFTWKGREDKSRGTLFGECWLKSQGGLSQGTFEEGTVSGPRTCGDCFEENTDYFGHDINYPAGRGEDRRNSAAECQELCSQTEGCNFFTWKSHHDNSRRTLAGECWLKTRGGESEARYEVGTISGPSECGEDGMSLIVEGGDN